MRVRMSLLMLLSEVMTQNSSKSSRLSPSTNTLSPLSWTLSRAVLTASSYLVDYLAFESSVRLTYLRCRLANDVDDDPNMEQSFYNIFYVTNKAYCYKLALCPSSQKKIKKEEQRLIY